MIYKKMRIKHFPPFRRRLPHYPVAHGCTVYEPLQYVSPKLDTASPLTRRPS